MRFDNPGYISEDETSTPSRPKFRVQFLKAEDPANPDSTNYVLKENARPETFSFPRDGRGHYLREQLAAGNVRMGYFKIDDRYGAKLATVVRGDRSVIGAREYFENHHEIPDQFRTDKGQDGRADPEKPAPVDPKSLKKPIVLTDLEKAPDTGHWNYTLHGERHTIQDGGMNETMSSLDMKFRANRILRENIDNVPALESGASSSSGTGGGLRISEKFPMPKGTGLLWLGAAGLVILLRALAAVYLGARGLIRYGQGAGNQGPPPSSGGRSTLRSNGLLNEEDAKKLDLIPPISRLEVSDQGVGAMFQDHIHEPMLRDVQEKELCAKIREFVSSEHPEVIESLRKEEEEPKTPKPARPKTPSPAEILRAVNGGPEPLTDQNGNDPSQPSEEKDPYSTASTRPSSGFVADSIDAIDPSVFEASGGEFGDLPPYDPSAEEGFDHYEREENARESPPPLKDISQTAPTSDVRENNGAKGEPESAEIGQQTESSIGEAESEPVPVRSRVQGLQPESQEVEEVEVEVVESENVSPSSDLQRGVVLDADIIESHLAHSGSEEIGLLPEPGSFPSSTPTEVPFLQDWKPESNPSVAESPENMEATHGNSLPLSEGPPTSLEGSIERLAEEAFLSETDEEELVEPPPGYNEPAASELFDTLDFVDHQHLVDSVENPLKALREKGITGRAVEGKNAAILAYTASSELLSDDAEKRAAQVSNIAHEIASLDHIVEEEQRVEHANEFSEANLPSEKGVVVIMPAKSGNKAFVYRFELDEDLGRLSYQEKLGSEVLMVRERIKMPEIEPGQQNMDEPNMSHPEDDIEPVEISEEEEKENQGVGVEM
jgi:hypothetical protein